MNNNNTLAEDNTPTSTRSKFTRVLCWVTGILLCAVISTVLFTLNNTGGYFVIVLLYALLFLASYSDAAFRRIPNSFNYPALILALILMMVICPACELFDCHETLLWLGANSSTWGGIAFESLLGFALCLLIGIISFAVHGLGGGDAKLLLTVGVLAGFHLTISILLNTLFIALFIGILNLISNGLLIKNLQRVLLVGYRLCTRQESVNPVIFNRNESPFSLSVFLALILLPFINLNSYILNFQW